MIVAQVEADITHTPSSVVGIFANTLNNEATRKVFKIKGVYLAGKGVEYNNYYYDTLKEEHSESSITIVVPALLRSSLTEQRTIECIAYLSKRLQPIGSRVDLLLNVIEVLSQKESAYTQDELQAFEVLQKKAAIGYRDVDGFIRNKIIHEERVAITILIGKSAIIDGDIKHQLNATSVAYDIEFARINLSSQGSIIEALYAHQRDCDILVIARGGGERLEIFNNPQIAEHSLELKPFLLTAIGHKEDVTLLQKVADKFFITPTALGQYLADTYNETLEQVQNTKSKTC